jgi:hypothetical protein
VAGNGHPYRDEFYSICENALINQKAASSNPVEEPNEFHFEFSALLVDALARTGPKNGQYSREELLSAVAFTAQEPVKLSSGRRPCILF